MNQVPVLCTVEEIAQFLKVSVHTIYYWVSRREIPSLRVGKHLRFDRDQVLAHFLAVSQENRKAIPCLSTAQSVHSGHQSWSLKTSANSADSSKKGIGNGNH